MYRKHQHNWDVFWNTDSKCFKFKLRFQNSFLSSYTLVNKDILKKKQIKDDDDDDDYYYYF